MLVNNKSDVSQLEENQNVFLPRLWCHKQDMLMLPCLITLFQHFFLFTEGSLS